VSELGTIDHVASLLESLDIKFTREENVLMMRLSTEHIKNLKVKIATNEDGSWVYIIHTFAKYYDTDEGKRAKLAYDMLRASWEANGVKFAIDDDDDIILLAETNDTDLIAEEMKTLIGHLVHACDTLWEIYPRQ
jgi:hypothetical protein